MFRINILSLSLFLIFLFSYLAKAIHLKSHYKIQANVLGKGKRNRETRRIEVVLKFATFSWGVTWFFLSIAEPGISQWFHPFFEIKGLSHIGLFIIALGLGVFIAAMMEMKTSWRVGIDKNSKTTLVTEGIYRLSRNPAFLGFDLMFAGLFLTYSNLLTLGITVINVWAIHKQILEEEKHLRRISPEEYIRYSSQTKRYLFF